jgi:hypothetical protein
MQVFISANESQWRSYDEKADSSINISLQMHANSEVAVNYYSLQI